MNNRTVIQWQFSDRRVGKHHQKQLSIECIKVSSTDNKNGHIHENAGFNRKKTAEKDQVFILFILI